MNTKFNPKVSVIYPSKPIEQFQNEFNKGIDILLVNNFIVENNEKFSLTTEPSLKAKAINACFKDEALDILWSAVGGDQCESLIEKLDFGLIKDQKLIGSSDNTHLILSAYLKTGSVTYYGPNIINLPELSLHSLTENFSFLKNETELNYPSRMAVIKKGNADGILFGGNLFALNNIIEKYSIDQLDKLVIFFEEIEDEVTNIEKEITRLKSSGILKKTKAIIIGNLISKEPLDIGQKFADYDMPIIKVDYFGHKVKDFYIFPIGRKVSLDTSLCKIELS
jgi:muramoyltetrapeptide carboxypeptidase